MLRRLDITDPKHPVLRSSAHKCRCHDGSQAPFKIGAATQDPGQTESIPDSLSDFNNDQKSTLVGNSSLSDSVQLIEEEQSSTNDLVDYPVNERLSGSETIVGTVDNTIVPSTNAAS